MLQGFIHIEAKELSFSINSHSNNTDRILPQVFQDKVQLCLYEEGKDNEQTLLDLKVCLSRFVSICRSYGVQSNDGQIAIGTSLEQAPNLDQILDVLKATTGWPVKVLDDAEEFKAYIYGLAGAFHPVRGLYLKVTARVVYLGWIYYTDDKKLLWGPRHELPYGGVTLARRLSKESFLDVEQLVAERVKQVYEEMHVPQELAEVSQKEGGIRVYMHSRGLPYVAKFFHGESVDPIILGSFNTTGFSCTAREIIDVQAQEIENYTTNLAESSQRRAAFFEATLLLLKGLCKGIPQIRKVLYDRSTVREGILFQQMPSNTFALDPLIVSTEPYALPGAQELAAVLATAVPSDAPIIIRSRIIPAVCNASYVHSSYPRQSQAILGLCIGLGGVLTGVHGLTHEVRVLLGLALYKRWGGEASEASTAIISSFTGLFNDSTRFWWALYVGSVMHILGGIFPGAHVQKDVVSFEVEGNADEFVLHVRPNQKSVLANNKVVFDRLRKLPLVLNDAARLTGMQKNAARIQVDWYSN